jgi:hypothetical protein
MQDCGVDMSETILRLRMEQIIRTKTSISLLALTLKLEQKFDQLRG